MNIRTTLTFDETQEFIKYCVENVFLTDEAGEDVSYHPTLKQIAISDMYNKLYLGKDVSTLTDADYLDFLVIDDKYDVFNSRQWNFIMDCIDELIQDRKVKLYTKQNNNSVDSLVKELLQEKIDKIKQEKQFIQQTKEMNESYGKDDMNNFATALSDFNKNFNDPTFQKSLVSALTKFNNKTKPQDHKKSTKKSKVVELDKAGE